MPKCRKNRYRRLKRNKQHLATIFRKKAQTHVVSSTLKACRVNGDYYRVQILAIRWRYIPRLGGRMLQSVRTRVVPNAKYRQMQAELLTLMRNPLVTVPLADIFPSPADSETAAAQKGEEVK